jgi:hypothetical protein
MFHRRSCGTSLSQRVINSGASAGGAGSAAYLNALYGGAIGPTGMTWDNSVYIGGITGPTGRVGPQQSVGACNTGPTGGIGLVGHDGSADVAGPTGSVGYVGHGGLVGAMGPTGITPTTAPVGAMGATGPAGDAGPYGGYEAIFEAKYTADSILYLPSIVNIAPNVIIHATLIGGGGGGGGSFQNYGGSGGGSGYKEVVTFITPTVDMSLNIFVGGGGAGGIGYAGVITSHDDLSGTNGYDGSDTYITLSGPNTSNTVVAHAAGGKGAEYYGGGDGEAGGGCGAYVDPSDIVLFFNSDATIPGGTVTRLWNEFSIYQYMHYYVVGGGGGGSSGVDGAWVYNYAGGGGGSGYQVGYLPLYDPVENVLYDFPSSSRPAAQFIKLGDYPAAHEIVFIVGGGGSAGSSGSGGSGGSDSHIIIQDSLLNVFLDISAQGGIGGQAGYSGTGFPHYYRGYNGNGGAGYYGGGGGAGGYSGSSGGAGCTFEGGYNGGGGTYDGGGPDIYAGAGGGASGPGANGGGCRNVGPSASSDTVGGDGGGSQLYYYYDTNGVKQFPKYKQICGAEGTDETHKDGSGGIPYSGQGGGGGAYYQGYHAAGNGGSGLIVVQFHANPIEPHLIPGKGRYDYMDGKCPGTVTACPPNDINNAGDGGGVCAGAAGTSTCSINYIVGGGGGGGFGGGDGGGDTGGGVGSNGDNGSYYGAGGGGGSYQNSSQVKNGGMGYEGVAYIKIYNLY